MNGNNGFSVDLRLERRRTARCGASPTRCSTPSRRRGIPTATTCSSPSDREFAPQISTVEFNFATNRTTGIFALALRKDVKHPFPPESDEVTIADEKKDEPKTDEKKPDEKKAEAAAEAKKDATPEDKKTTMPVPAGSELVIDFDGLAAARGARAARRPTTTAACRRRRATCSTPSAAPASTTAATATASRRCASSRSRTARRRRCAEDVGGYALSADGAKVLVAQQGGDATTLYDATPSGARTRRRRSRPPA